MVGLKIKRLGIRVPGEVRGSGPALESSPCSLLAGGQVGAGGTWPQCNGGSGGPASREES